jgi:hypothetical protein
MILDDGKLRQVKLALFLGFAFVIVGAFMPWVTVGPFSRNGLDGDGVLTLLLAVIGGAVALLARRPRGMLIAVSTAAMILVIGIYDFLDVAWTSAASVGIGLYLTVAGGLIATAAAGLLAFNLFKRPAAPQPSEPGGPAPDA